MLIGFIGGGTLTRTIGRHLVLAGHTVVVCNSRGPETLGEAIAAIGPGSKAGTKADVLEAEIVILATNWLQAPKALAGIDWRGQILIDGTNPHSSDPADMSPEGVKKSIQALDGKVSSAIIASYAPGARVVKSISTVPMAWINDFSKSKPRTVFFVAGDDQDAKNKVIQLWNSVGFEGVDTGSLLTGGVLQQLGGSLSGLNLTLVKRLR